MKKLLLILLAVSVAGIAAAQNSSEPGLQKRLDHYFQLNTEKNIDGILDYIHPSLFKIAPKDQIAIAFKQLFDNEQMSLSMDSLYIIKISPDFKHNNILYKKIDYGMLARIQFKDSTMTNDQEIIDLTITSFKSAFEGGKVSFNKTSNSFEIIAPSILIAIKDNPSTPWLFLGYQKNEEMLKILYPAEVRTHYKL